MPLPLQIGPMLTWPAVSEGQPGNPDRAAIPGQLPPAPSARLRPSAAGPRPPLAQPEMARWHHMRRASAKFAPSWSGQPPGMMIATVGPPKTGQTVAIIKRRLRAGRPPERRLRAGRRRV
jgi:hypothetical protein